MKFRCMATSGDTHADFGIWDVIVEVLGWNLDGISWHGDALNPLGLKIQKRLNLSILFFYIRTAAL